MGMPFSFTGKAYRGFLSVIAMNLSSYRNENGYFSSLMGYLPVSSLLGDNISPHFPVVGSMHKTDVRLTNRSPRHDERFLLKRDSESRFGQVFTQKLECVMSQAGMTIIDRARLEEMRAFLFDTLCTSFFGLHDMNFPRVLHLLEVVKNHATPEGTISDEMLNTICPTECTALLSNEAILTKESVDLNSTWYRANNGIKSFAALVNRFNLLNGHKLMLLNSVLPSQE